jgi:hypothetical protein
VEGIAPIDCIVDLFDTRITRLRLKDCASGILGSRALIDGKVEAGAMDKATTGVALVGLKRELEIRRHKAGSCSSETTGRGHVDIGQSEAHILA